jgi:hypothetical protein
MESAPKRVDWKKGNMDSYYKQWGSFSPEKVRIVARLLSLHVSHPKVNIHRKWRV